MYGPFKYPPLSHWSLCCRRLKRASRWEACVYLIGNMGPCPPRPVKISHKNDGCQRRLHRFHVSRPPLTRPLDSPTVTSLYINLDFNGYNRILHCSSTHTNFLVLFSCMRKICFFSLLIHFPVQKSSTNSLVINPCCFEGLCSKRPKRPTFFIRNFDKI